MRTRRVSSYTQNMHEKNEKFLFLGVSLTPKTCLPQTTPAEIIPML